ncbi:hypothetical protein BDW_06450 [Bdellovibrio bacteriovorus W]|nr:hypothetical protein BDW_06450 [Bdellovibrio bacteriovorus W]
MQAALMAPLAGRMQDLEVWSVHQTKLDAMVPAQMVEAKCLETANANALLQMQIINRLLKIPIRALVWVRC